MQNFPAELKSRSQWCIAGSDKAPHVVNGTMLTRVSVTDLNGLMTFDAALAEASARGLKIGYVLSATDEYTCIDLDIKDGTSLDRFKQPLHRDAWTTVQDLERFQSIIKTFNSYTELSSSGKGIHIWVKGNIGKGRRRGTVEVYSQERFIICTGTAITMPNYVWDPVNVSWTVPTADLNILALADRQIELNNMVSQLNEIREAINLVEIEPTHDDQQVLDMAANASNNEKFLPLWNGDWRSLGYPSQSEADFSLMSMFTFYSKSNEQCRRLFRLSMLGKREKAVKNNYYLNKALESIRARQMQEEAEKAVFTNMSKGLLANLEKQLEPVAEVVEEVTSKTSLGFSFVASTVEPLTETEAVDTSTGEITTLPSASNTSLVGVIDSGMFRKGMIEASNASGLKPEDLAIPDTFAPLPKEAGVVNHTNLPWYVPHPKPNKGEQEWPSGLIGQIAAYIYYSAPLPVREVAIIGAFGMMAGICGKAWNIPGSGLNLYMVLLARSGAGKEAMHSGTSALASLISDVCPSINSMIDTSNHVSGPALRKWCLANPSTCNFSSEIGKKFKRMANPMDGNMQDMRTVMTEAYSKSAAHHSFGAVKHSNKDNDVQAARGVAFSIVGESTPGTFLKSLTEEMMEDGFLSRFGIIEHKGLRPQLNDRPNMTPPPDLLECLINMVKDADANISCGATTQVGLEEDASVFSTRYATWLTDQINTGNCGHEIENESIRQVYSRCHLKFLRMSALVCLSNYYSTGYSAMGATGNQRKRLAITLDDMKWAHSFTERNRKWFLSKIDGGDIGVSESTRRDALMITLKEYISGKADKLGPALKKMQQSGIVTHATLRQRLARKQCFKEDRVGPTKLINEIINDFITDGFLVLVDKNELASDFSKGGKAYRIIELP